MNVDFDFHCVSPVLVDAVNSEIVIVSGGFAPSGEPPDECGKLGRLTVFRVGSHGAGPRISGPAELSPSRAIGKKLGGLTYGPGTHWSESAADVFGGCLSVVHCVFSWLWSDHPPPTGPA
jgi:hypothetical protein